MPSTTLIDLNTIASITLFLTTIVVAHSANQHQQFYPTVVHLVSSKISRIVLICDLILAIIYFGKLLKNIFFGTLRMYEEEVIWEKGYFTLIETCLALTIFREELTSRMLTVLGICLFMKIFHWISELRVKHIESLPNTSLSTFIRLYICLIVLIGVDCYFIYNFILHYLKEGATVRVLFLSDFVVMGITSLSVIIRLTFHAINLSKQDEEGTGGWEGRDVSIFYLDISSEILQSFTYLSFFLIIMSKYGLPFHLIRNIYIAVNNVKKRVMDLINYRRIAINLDRRFPDATQQDLDEYDGVCVVCREDMRINTTQNPIKKLPCGHMFHAKCLRGCLERAQECPTCRRPIDVLLSEQEHREHHSSNNNTPTTTPTANNTTNISPTITLPQSFNLSTSVNIDNNLLLQQQQIQQLLLSSSTTIPNLINNNNFTELQKVMSDMYIRYLESMRDNITITLEQLKQLNENNND
ncbi:hypothetical protein ABK040_010038 [Willaertia magna]